MKMRQPLTESFDDVRFILISARICPTHNAFQWKKISQLDHRVRYYVAFKLRNFNSVAGTKSINKEQLTMHKGARKSIRLRVTVLSTSGLWMCFVPQIYMQELTKQREMLYTVELVCYIPPIYHLTQPTLWWTIRLTTNLHSRENDSLYAYLCCPSTLWASLGYTLSYSKFSSSLVILSNLQAVVGDYIIIRHSQKHKNVKINSI